MELSNLERLVCHETKPTKILYFFSRLLVYKIGYYYFWMIDFLSIVENYSLFWV